MARSSQRAKLLLSKEERERLQKIAQSRTLPLQGIQRAEILLLYADGMLITEIGKDLHISRPTIYKWIDKALALGIEEGLKDKYHRPKAPVITEEAKVWVINIACKKPTDYGYAAEMWTRKSLADHVRHYGQEAGHDCLKKAVKAIVHRILEEHPIRPHKMAYYLERRDPDFEKKMVDILCVYKEVNLQNATMEPGGSPSVVTISVDEKPGVQAIRNITPDIMPEPGKQSSVSSTIECRIEAA